MNKENVPQDKSSLAGKNMKELCYAVDKDGNYTTVLSEGWEPKTIALNNSMDLIEERVQQASKDVLAGKSSPLVYFMELQKMDPQILASYAGMWKWQVKRHFKPSVFKKLNDTILARYAKVFEISVEELKNFKGA